MAVVAPIPRGQREQCGGRKARTAEQRARGEAKDVQEIAYPAGEPHVADFLADLSEAEFHRDAAAGLGFGDAGGGEVGDAAIQVILELVVEFAFQRPAAEPVNANTHSSFKERDENVAS